MRYQVLILIIIFFFSTESFAGKLKVGETYSGTLTKLYLYDNALPLPPGSWKVYEIKKNGDFQRVDFDGKDGSTIRAYLPTTKQEAGRWVGKKPNCSDVKDDSGGEILAEGNDPKAVGTNFYIRGGYAYWCIIKRSNAVLFSAHILQEKQYTIYYNFPVKITSINSNTAKKYGDRFFKQILMAFNGKKSASLNFLSEIIGKNNNSSSSFSSSYNSTYSYKDISTYTDEMICLQATSNDGLSWEKFPSKFYDEALNRGLSIETCNNLTNRIKVTSRDSSSIKSKLKELKGLLDEGLITQDDFDKKKNELLEEF